MKTIYVSKTCYKKAQETFEKFNKQTDYVFESVDDNELSLAKAIALNNVSAFIADIVPYQKELYEALPAGGIIARYGVGHDSIDKELASANGIYVTNTPGVLDNAVAEHACWMLGSVSRHVHQAHQSLVEGDWNPQVGVELKNKKVTILGFGGIGQSLCQKLSFGFGMQVTGVGRSTVEQFALKNQSNIEQLKAKLGFHNYTHNIDEAIADADYVVLLMPVSAETQHMANADFFQKMKPSAVFVNSARGALVCENNLYDALNQGVIAAAAVDVFEVEPYVPQSTDKDLRTLSNLLVTPHVGSNTVESNAAMATSAIQNIITIIEHGANACPNIINP